MTKHIAELILRNTERISKECTSPAELEKALLEHQASIAGFKSEVLKTQELHLASLTRDTERLQNDSDKIRAELKYEINKLTASQRLDLNLEKGCARTGRKGLWLTPLPSLHLTPETRERKASAAPPTAPVLLPLAWPLSRAVLFSRG